MKTLINANSQLTAIVGNNGKGGTDITIKADTVTVGHAVLGGNYNQRQALYEFQKSPHRFDTKGRLMLLKQLGLVK